MVVASGEGFMSSQDAIRWSGLAAIIAGVLLPFGPLARLFFDSHIALFTSISNVGFVFLIFALTGIGRVLVDKIGAPGVFVVIAGTVGAVLLIADGVVSAYVYPVVDGASLAKVEGSPGLALVSAVGPLALLLASALLALVAGRVPALPGWAAWIMLAGALLNSLANVVAPATIADPLALASSIIFTIGLARLGVRLRSRSPSPGSAGPSGTDPGG